MKLNIFTSTGLKLGFGFILSCSQPTDIDKSEDSFPSPTLSISEWVIAPESIAIDTFITTTQNKTINFQVSFKPNSEAEINGITGELTILKPTGQIAGTYKASNASLITSGSIVHLVFQGVLPVDPTISNLSSELIITSGAKKAEIIQPIHFLASTQNPLSIDQITLTPSDSVKIGNPYQLNVIVGSRFGLNSISKVTLFGKRPDGTAQNPIDLVKSSTPGLFQINSVAPTAQTGVYQWTFIAYDIYKFESEPKTILFKLVP